MTFVRQRGGQLCAYKTTMHNVNVFDVWQQNCPQNVKVIDVWQQPRPQNVNRNTKR